MAGAALVLVEEGTQALFGGKYFVEKHFPLSEPVELRRLETWKRLPGESCDQWLSSPDPSLGAGSQGEGKEKEGQPTHLQNVTFPIRRPTVIFKRGRRGSGLGRGSNQHKVTFEKV